MKNPFEGRGDDVDSPTDSLAHIMDQPGPLTRARARKLRENIAAFLERALRVEVDPGEEAWRIILSLEIQSTHGD